MNSVPEVPEGYKRCTKCGEVLPFTPEFFPRNGGNELRPNCKTCNNLRKKEYALTHADYLKTHRKHYYEVHKEERIAASRAYRDRNPEKSRDTNRRSHQKHKEKHSEINKRWRKNHPELVKAGKARYRENHRELLREKNRRRYYNDPDKARFNKIQRISRMADLPFDFKKEDEARALDYWHGCCAVCGRPLRDLFNEHYPAFDHWIPITSKHPNNPGTVPWNMIPLCHGIDGCNCRKHNFDPREWLEKEYGKRKAAQIIRRIEEFFEWVRTQSP